LKIILFLKCWRKKFGPIIELFTQKIVTKLSKNGFGIRDLEKTYSGSRILGPGSKRHRILDPGSRIRIRNTAKNKEKICPWPLCIGLIAKNPYLER
jgi:hypothetical protein